MSLQHSTTLKLCTAVRSCTQLWLYAAIGLISIAAPLVAELYEIHAGFEIQTPASTKTTYSNTMCGCRKQCSVQHNCSAVTAVQEMLVEGDGMAKVRYNCHFLLTRVVYNSQLVPAGAKVVTMIKRRPCLEPFKVFPGLGCITIDSMQVSYWRAFLSCPVGSQLLTPGNDTGVKRAFHDLLFYLLQKNEDKDELNFWVGFYRSEDSTQWTWLDDISHPSAPGSGLWGPEDPNDRGSKRARLVGRRESAFGLMDTLDYSDYQFICELEHYY
ncbi:C-type lectin fold [Trinorchestia longiramus]|nr:C-type lectin fold [Trinorchestia longiramus]